MLRAASTWPSAEALSSTASTAKAMAIGAMVVPQRLTAWEAKKKRNRRSARGASDSRQVTSGFISNSAAVIATLIVPSVRGGRAASWSRVVASSREARTAR